LTSPGRGRDVGPSLVVCRRLRVGGAMKALACCLSTSPGRGRDADPQTRCMLTSPGRGRCAPRRQSLLRSFLAASLLPAATPRLRLRPPLTHASLFSVRAEIPNLKLPRRRNKHVRRDEAETTHTSSLTLSGMRAPVTAAPISHSSADDLAFEAMTTIAAGETSSGGSPREGATQRGTSEGATGGGGRSAPDPETSTCIESEGLHRAPDPESSTNNKSEGLHGALDPGTSANKKSEGRTANS
jgi:hypothetical protein